MEKKYSTASSRLKPNALTGSKHAEKLLAKRHADTEASWACKASTLRNNETTK